MGKKAVKLHCEARILWDGGTEQNDEGGKEQELSTKTMEVER